MYSIGQVLFVVLTKKSQVYPMQVVETITKRTLNGEEVSYVLQAGAEKSSQITLDKVEGEVFDSADKARKILTHRANEQINKLVDVAIAKSVEWYGIESQPQTIHELPEIVPQPISVEEDVKMVTLPDGSVVKVKIPKIAND